MPFLEGLGYIIVISGVLMGYRWLDTRRESAAPRGRGRPGTPSAPAPDADPDLVIARDLEARALATSLEQRMSKLERAFNDLSDTVEHRWRRAIARNARSAQEPPAPEADSDDEKQVTLPFAATSGAARPAAPRPFPFPRPPR